MDSFDQKRADRDAVFYNTDGRLFDLLETDGKLELRSRSNAFGWHMLLMSYSFLVSLGLSIWGFSTLMSWQKLLIIVVVTIICGFISQGIMRFFGFYEPVRWLLDKSSKQLYADKKKLALLEDIAQVRAFKFRRRLKLVVELKNGRELHLGWLRFAGKEWAWRQDAAQIAAFLGVPLEIPPL